MATRTRLTASESRFMQRQRVGHLATANAQGTPHVVPVCFGFDNDHFFMALDEKAKRVPDSQLKRVRNIAERAEVSLVVDAYDEDWSRLGYILITGQATLAHPGTEKHATALTVLRARYPQYHLMRLEDRPVIALRPSNISSWGAATQEDERAPLAPDGRGLDFLPLARGRRSVRRYEDRPVEQSAIEQVLEAARWAPSPHGRQPWRFVVLTSSQHKLRLSAAMGDEWQRILAMDGQPAHVVVDRLNNSRERIMQAPALILACLYLQGLDEYPDPQRQDAEHTMAVQSLGAAIQNMLLAAYTLGLDTGWMCAPLFCSQVVREALQLDAALIPHALIALGYAARDPVRRPRLSLHDLVSFLD